MKKLTALIAVVALGLLSTLTANAQLKLVYTQTAATARTPGVAPYATNNGLHFVENLTVTDFATLDLVTPTVIDFYPGKVSFWADLTEIASTTPFFLTTKYTFSVVNTLNNQTLATSNFDLVYSVFTTSLGTKIIPKAADLSTGTQIANLDFVFKSQAISLNIWDFSEGTQSFGLTKRGSQGTAADTARDPAAVIKFSADYTVAPVPEPSTYALMGASGLAALAGLRRFRGKKASKA